MIGKHEKPSDCAGCPLHHSGAGYVPGVGPAAAPIALLAEAPGYDEVAYGQPMVGAAGGMLTRILRRTYRTREQFRIENVYRCCPPQYEIKKEWAEIASFHCAGYRSKHLAQAKVIVAMGGTAIRTLLDLWDWDLKDLVNNFHGTVHDLPSGQQVVCTFHPSYLQRGAHNLMGTVADDLEVAQEVLEGRWERDLIDPVIDPHPEWFKRWVAIYEQAVAQDPNIDLALDIETPDKAKGKAEDELGEDDASMQIDRFNVAWHNDEGVTVPNVEPYRGFVKRLVKAARIVDGWNFDYDYKRLVKHEVVFHPEVEIRDGMWLWHHFRSDVPRGLGFAAPTCSTHGAWKHLFRSAPAEYAAYDGPQTRRTIHGTIEGLIARGQWEVAHRHTTVLMQQVLKPAQVVGIQVDRPALDAFEADLTRKAEQLLEALQQYVPVETRALTGGPKNQGLTRPPTGLHPDATLVKKDGTRKKDADDQDPLKVALYARYARVEEHRVPRKVLCCQACGQLEVHSKHRCADKALAPQVGLREVMVTRWFWREPMNPDSPPQVMAYLKRKKHKPGRNKKTKKDAVDKETLKRLAASTKDPFYFALLKYRAVGKVRGTYAIGVRKRLDSENRFHPVPTLKPSTLRTSYNTPNIQNVVGDKGGADAPAAGFRRCIVASPGCRLFEFDFSGIEARLLGWFARGGTNDSLYYRLSGLGVHAYLASHLINKPADLHWSDTDLSAYFKSIKKQHPMAYDRAKRTVHGNGYGMTHRGMFLMFPELYDNERAAKRVQDLYFEIAPTVHAWQSEVQRRAQEQTYIGGVPLPGKTILTDPNAHPYGYRHEFYSVVAYRPVGPKALKRLEAERVPLVEINGRQFAATRGEDAKRCVTPDTKVWMGDYTYKTIADVKVGDLVIGWRRGDGPKLPSRGNYGTKYMRREKTYVADHLTRARVTEVHNLIDTTYTVTTAAGRTVKCTGDHKWLGLRRKEYAWLRTDQLRVGDTLAAVDVTDPGDCPEALRLTAAWLGGFYDGEGSHRGVAQANTTYGDLLQQAEAAFAALGFQTARQAIHPELTTRRPATQLNWTGGRQAALRFARQVPSYRFRAQWADRMILGGRFRRLDPIVKIERNPVAEPVVCLTTTTGNFIANDLCSHNCLAFYPQSTAAGVIKEAALALFTDPDHPSYIGDAYFGRTPLRAPIHDSLLLEIPERQEDRVVEAVFREMLRPVEEMPLPPEWHARFGAYLTIGVEAKVGRNWEEVEGIGTPTFQNLGLENHAGIGNPITGDRTYFPAEEAEEDEVDDLRQLSGEAGVTHD